MSTNLSRRRSIFPCNRDALRSAMTTSFCGSRRHHGELVLGVLPDQLVDADVLLLAAQRLGILIASALFHRRRKLGRGLRGGENLSASGELGKPRRDVDAVAEQITGILDRGAEMESDMHGDRRAETRALRGDAQLNLHGGVRRSVRRRERGHDLVADVLDDATSPFLAGAPRDRQTALYRRLRFGVAQQIVHLRAGRNVGEEDGEVFAGLVHALESSIGVSREYNSWRRKRR